MKIDRSLMGIFAAGVVLATQGCMSSRSKLPVYGPAQVGTVLKVEAGGVISVRDVVIKSSPGMGGPSGARYPGSIIGVVGAVMGTGIGTNTGDVPGEEIMIKMEDGNIIVVVQERGAEPPMAAGEKVHIITSTPAIPSSGRGSIGILSGIGRSTTRVVRDERFASAGL